jgi:ankyrin repeat protein
MKRIFLIVVGTTIFAVILGTPALSSTNDEAFFKMVRNDDLEGVNAAIAEGQDVNAKEWTTGKTALFFVSGDARIAEALIRAGANVNARDSANQTPLHFHTSSRANVVEILVAASADVNAADNAGVTPLYPATIMLRRNPEEKLRIVQILLAAGADVNAYPKGEPSLLMRASLGAALAQDNDVHRLVEMLLKAGADVNAKEVGGMSALHWWSSERKPGVIRLLLDAGADVNSGNMPSLAWAVFAPDNVQILEMLIEAGADVNAVFEGATALSLAAALGNAENVSVLLKAGARLESAPDRLTPLHLATGIIAMERKGVTGSFKERAKQTTSFFLMQGQEFSPDFLGVAKLLVEAGADIDSKTKSGDLLKILFGFSIEADDVDYRQFENKTPLEFAQLVGNEEVADYLFKIKENL